MPLSNEGKREAAQTEIDLTIRERQPDPADPGRSALEVRLYEPPGVDQSARTAHRVRAVTGIVGLIATAVIAVATALAAGSAGSGADPMILTGGALLAVAALVVTALSARPRRRRY